MKNLYAKGATTSQESESTCGTNNSAFFRMEDSTEMKYSISDITGEASCLVNSLTRSHEETNIEAKNESVGVNVIENEGEGGALKSTQNKSKLHFTSSTPQVSNSASPDSQRHYNIPDNAKTIFRHQTSAALRHQPASQINPASPIHGSSGDGTGEANLITVKAKNSDEIRQVSLPRTNTGSINTGSSANPSTYPSMSASASVSAGTSLFQASWMSNHDVSSQGNTTTSSKMNSTAEESKSKASRTDTNQFTFDNVSHPSILNSSTEALNSKGQYESADLTEGEKELLQKAQDHFISVTKISNSISSQTLETEENGENDENDEKVRKDKSDGNSTKDNLELCFTTLCENLKIQKQKVIEQFESCAENMTACSSNLTTSCSTQVSSAIVLGSTYKESILERYPMNSKSTEHVSSIDECRSIMIEQWTKNNGIKVSELYDFLKNTVDPATYSFSAQKCGVLSQSYSLNTTYTPLSIIDNSVARNATAMNSPVDETSNEEGKVIETVESINDPASVMERNRSRSQEAGTNGVGLEATNIFMKEVDEYATKLGVERSEFLSKVALMITKSEDQRLPRGKNPETIQDMLTKISSCISSQFRTQNSIENNPTQEDEGLELQNQDQPRTNNMNSGDMIRELYVKGDSTSMAQTTNGKDSMSLDDSKGTTDTKSLKTSKEATKMNVDSKMIDLKKLRSTYLYPNSPRRLKTLRVVGTLINEEEAAQLNNEAESEGVIDKKKDSAGKRSQIIKIISRVGLGKSNGKEVKKSPRKFVKKGRFRLIA
jgi:hypothetical protein